MPTPIRDRYFIIKDIVLNTKEWDSAMNLLASCPSRSLDIQNRDLNSYSYEERSIIARLNDINTHHDKLREEIRGSV